MSWRRFRPIAYSLSEKCLAFPLQQTKTSANGSRPDQVSVWELLQELESEKYEIDDQLTQLIVATESETRILEADNCMLPIAAILLES
jgi:hypothetical protein